MYDLKRIAAINDLSCYGKCSLTVILPVFSAMGSEVCPLPTALLSSHTVIEGFSFLDLSDEMEKIIKHWQKMNLSFDCLYSGFLGSERQIDIVAHFFDSFGSSTLKVVDPVMGDNGKIYSTYTKEMCSKMLHLVKKADVITPNLTEAALLLECDYIENPDENTVENWLFRLCEMGPKIAVITGIKQGKIIKNIAFNKQNKTYSYSTNPIVDINMSGTGDLFASLLTGCIIRGMPLEKSLQHCGNFLYNALCDTVTQNHPHKDGILYEKQLKFLEDFKK